MSVKLLWLPLPGHYRLRVFAGANTQTRAFSGELTLLAAQASELHRVLELGLGVDQSLDVTEVGWVEPAPARPVTGDRA